MRYRFIALLSAGVWAAYAPNATAQNFKQMITDPQNFCRGEVTNPMRQVPPEEHQNWVGSCVQLVNNNKDCYVFNTEDFCKRKVYQELERLKKTR